MQESKILIHAIDGADVWIPISARRIDTSQYELLMDPEFDETDTGTLFEFIPGDVVELDLHLFKNGKKELIAKKLVVPSKRSDKMYFEFQFGCVQGSLQSSIEVLHQYEQVLQRIEAEMEHGQFFYPHVVKKLKELKSLRERTS